MSRKFLQLKRDVAAFGASLNTLATYKQLSQNIEAWVYSVIFYGQLDADNLL